MNSAFPKNMVGVSSLMFMPYRCVDLEAVCFLQRHFPISYSLGRETPGNVVSSYSRVCFSHLKPTICISSHEAHSKCMDVVRNSFYNDICRHNMLGTQPGPWSYRDQKGTVSSYHECRVLKTRVCPRRVL